MIISLSQPKRCTTECAEEEVTGLHPRHFDFPFGGVCLFMFLCVVYAFTRPKVLWLTKPEEWSNHAMLAATKVFASNFNAKMAQRFYNIFLLVSPHNSNNAWLACWASCDRMVRLPPLNISAGVNLFAAAASMVFLL